MQHLERPSTVIVVVVTLVLAGVVGLVIPLASGSRPSREQVAWESPTPTAPAPTASATSSATSAPTLSETSAPPATPTFKPPTATQPVDLTLLPSPTAESRPTQPPAPAPTQPPQPTATAQPDAAAILTPGTRIGAVVAVDLLNLRDGPGQGFGVIGLARSGEIYTPTARSGDGTWLQVCCFNQLPAWLASRMVTVTGRIDSLPVAP